jgi:hypothetical protein
LVVFLSPNTFFLGLFWAATAPNYHAKMEILGRPGAYTQRVPGDSPNPSTT